MTHQLNLGVLPIESGEPTNGHGCVQHVVDLVEPLVVEENAREQAQEAIVPDW